MLSFLIFFEIKFKYWRSLNSRKSKLHLIFIFLVQSAFVIFPEGMISTLKVESLYEQHKNKTKQVMDWKAADLFWFYFRELYLFACPVFCTRSQELECLGNYPLYCFNFYGAGNFPGAGFI